MAHENDERLAYHVGRARRNVDVIESLLLSRRLSPESANSAYHELKGLVAEVHEAVDYVLDVVEDEEVDVQDQ